MKRRDIIALLGGAAACPLVARAQQPLKIHRIGILHPSATVSDMSETGDNPGYRAFFQELSRLGYVEKRNLLVDRYSGDGHIERYAEIAGKVVQLNPNAIFAVSSRMVENLKAATSAIPIVGLMADPIGFRLVASLSRPEGNVTIPIPLNPA